MLSLAGAACWLAPAASASGGPLIVAYDVPSTVQVNVPATFDATFTDSASTIGPISWTFGDGTASTSGAQSSHAWGAPGTYTVTVTAVDTAGDQTSDSFLVNVLPAPATATVPDPTPPTPTLLLGALQSNRRWTTKKGTVFTLSLNHQADVTLTFTRQRKGAHASTARALATLRTSVKAGERRIRFDGVIKPHRTLAPGAYTVTLTASAGSAISAPVTLDFTVQHARRLRHRHRP